MITCGTVRGGGIFIDMDHGYKNIISIQNLCEAWSNFICGKKNKKDVANFALAFSSNILELHTELSNKTYKHGLYEAFCISDPKPRSIHKATVRDRLLHHAIYRILYPIFDKKLIYDSYSCRYQKGTHKAVSHFGKFVAKVSRNHTRTAWVLKCDIKKFFANIDQDVLLKILSEHIQDKDIMWLLSQVIVSFNSGIPGKRLPLGNLTSQLLVNIYMNEFDQFVKHELKVKYYIRYADDFVVLYPDRLYLERILPLMQGFLMEKLKLTMHPNKISIRTLASGVDFLGWVHFPKHRVLRSSTKKRMFKNVKAKASKPETVQSYLGLLSHGNTQKLRHKVLKLL